MHSLLADPNSDYVNANYIDVSSSFSFLFIPRSFSFLVSYFSLLSLFPWDDCCCRTSCFHDFLCDFVYSDACEAWIYSRNGKIMPRIATYLRSVIYDSSISLCAIPPGWHPLELGEYFHSFNSLPTKSSACDCDPTWVLATSRSSSFPFLSCQWEEDVYSRSWG